MDFATDTKEVKEEIDIKEVIQKLKIKFEQDKLVFEDSEE